MSSDARIPSEPPVPHVRSDPSPKPAAACPGERRYETLLRSIDQGFCVVEVLFDESGRAVDYRYLETNAAFESHTGLVDAVGRSMRELAPTHEDSWFERYGRVALTGEPTQFESAARALGREFEVYAFRVDEPAQRRVAVLFKDITERVLESERRRQWIEALQRSEERWNVALEHFGEGVILADDVDQLIYWNPAARRIHGMSAATDGLGPLATQPFELWSADGTCRLDPSDWPIARLRRGEVVEGLELRLRPVHSKWERIVSYSGALVCTPSGERLVFLSVDDLTQQRRAERALRESEMRFRRLADTMPQLVWTAQADGVVDYYNTQVARYGGLRQTPLGRWIWEPILHPDDVERTIHAWQHSIATGETYECEHRVRMSDGSFRWHLSRAHRVGPPAALQWFGTATDVHDLKVAQEQLREADRRKDEFLAVLAHELRNPLAPLRNGLEVLRRTHADSEGGRSTRRMMSRQVDQMVRLLDDLLDTSRIARGKFELHREDVDVGDTVRRALETSRPLLDASGHRVELRLPEQPLHVLADAVRIAQVLTNLFNNAAHYTPPGTTITVRVDATEDMAQVVVEDEGPGIPSEMLERVFEPFVQLDTATRRDRQGGLGLGLALGRSIVELHGGSIRAFPRRDGPGSAFHVHLPRALPDPVAPPPSGIADPGPATALKVLVVDDNRDAAESLGMLLQLMGHRVRIANDGPGALELAASDPPDVVILDVGMPVMDGYEVARRLHSLPGRASMRIIALTGYGQAADRARSAEAGFDAHLVKPADPDALETLITGPPEALELRH